MKDFLKKLWDLLIDLFGFGEDPLLSDCANCGARFVAGPDNLVETGVQILAPEDFIFEDCAFIENDSAERAFSQLGIDADAVAQMREAEPGDSITTGAEPWCDHCLKHCFEDASLV